MALGGWDMEFRVRVLVSEEALHLICVMCEDTCHDHQIGCFSGLVVGSQLYTEILPRREECGSRDKHTSALITMITPVELSLQARH